MVKQHATEQPWIKEQIKRNIKNTWKNQKKRQQYYETKIKRDTATKIYGMQQKEF